MSLNILVTDDSSVTRSVIRKTLDLAGVPVGELHEASNGEEGLALLRANWIDLVFLDINMPVMGGVEMIEAMKTDGLLENIPVIIVSTEGSQTRIDDLKDMGVRAYIRKPFQPEELRAVVFEVLGLTDE